MAIALGDEALRRLLGATTITDVLEVAAEAVRCDTVSWSRLDVARHEVLDNATTSPDTDDDETFWATYHEHPLCHGRGDLLPVCAISDLLDRPAWHRTAIYAESFHPAGVEHELGVKLSRPPGQTNVLLFDRGPGPDFDDHDHLVLMLLRPHFDAAIRRITAPAVRATARERAVLELVQLGLTNRAIAHRLGVSPHTVRKHLENAFTRLGVHSRTEAVVALHAAAAD